jgi:ubiquinone/menaquinone biosynthesis C-methylase UbiE
MNGQPPHLASRLLGSALRLGPIRRTLLAAFGRPRGPLGRIGGRMMARANRSANRWLVELLEIRPGESALDVGCGPGVGIELLCTITPAGRVVGVDPSDEMMAQAQARNQARIRSGVVEIRKAPANQLPFPDMTFDAAMSINSLQVWPDPHAGLREIRRVLKPGGRIALGFTSAAGPLPDPAGSLRAAGFESVRQERRDGDVAWLATRPPEDRAEMP